MSPGQTANPSLRLPRPLGVAADDLDLVSLYGALVVQFEVDVLDQERPNFIAEAVGIQMTLELPKDQLNVHGTLSQRLYLEREPGFDLLSQDVRHNLVKVLKDLHRQLRLDTTQVDQFIK